MKTELVSPPPLPPVHDEVVEVPVRGGLWVDFLLLFFFAAQLERAVVQPVRKAAASGGNLETS